MSAPVGWDEKSWLDVESTHADLVKLVELLRGAIGQEDASADRICTLFEEIEQRASFGVMAASWCKE